MGKHVFVQRHVFRRIHFFDKSSAAMVGVYGMVDEISRMLRSLLETRVTRVLGTQSIAIFMKEMMINFGFFFGVTMVTLPYESNGLFHWI